MKVKATLTVTLSSDEAIGDLDEALGAICDDIEASVYVHVEGMPDEDGDTDDVMLSVDSAEITSYEVMEEVDA